MPLPAVAYRAIAAVYDGLAAKQRLVDEYTSSNRAAQLQEAAAQLESFRDRRDAAARVGVGLCRLV